MPPSATSTLQIVSCGTDPDLPFRAYLSLTVAQRCHDTRFMRGGRPHRGQPPLVRIVSPV
eukprot:7034184-Pyramimonas_sp.AAC.1